MLAIALALGGGALPAHWPAAITQLSSLPLLCLAIAKLAQVQLPPAARFAVALLAAIAAVPLLQLVPLPPALWTMLPGRGQIADMYAEAGIALPWLSISLDPGATWRTALTLIAGAAIFLSTLLLDRRARRRATLILIVFGFFSVIMGLSQAARGQEALGLFANRNHQAALLYCVLPFTAAWAVGSVADRRPQLMVSLALCLIVFVSLMLGIGLSRSRGGLLISSLTVIASMSLAGTLGGEAGPRRVRMIVAIAAAVGVLLIVQFALLRILPRLETGLEDARWEFARITFGAALQYLPFGSGIGTFEPVYASHQTLNDIADYFVNHAANDFVELWLEGGLLALGVLIAFLAWLTWTTIGMWRATASGRMSALDGAIARAAAIAVVALLIHSALDFPLRTTSISVVFAFACALLVPALDSDERRRMRRRRSTRTPRMATAETAASAAGLSRASP